MYRELLHKVELYPIRICFIECDNAETLYKKIPYTQYYRLDDFKALVWKGIYKQGSNDYICIYCAVFKKTSDGKTTVGDIVHELAHVKNYIFKKIGHTNCLDNDEPEAYLMGHITNIAFKFYKIGYL